VVAGLVAERYVLGDDGTKGATTDNNEVEITRLDLGTSVGPDNRRISASPGLVQTVANVAAEHVFGKIRDG
jgi:hypothetical protein